MASPRFSVITLLPELWAGFSSVGVVGQAVKNSEVVVELINPRDFTSDPHRTVDDRPFGGGDGMVLLAEPLTNALEAIPKTLKSKVIYLTPQGSTFTSQRAQAMAKEEHLIFVCGRYGGVDERFISTYVDEELSIGDYILSGGDLAAMVVVESVARFVPGVLGNTESALKESFSDGLLEAPLYTRPREWAGREVPQTLLSGDHKKIAQERLWVSLIRTQKRRPDLIESLLTTHSDTKQELLRAEKWLASLSNQEKAQWGLV